MASNVASQVLIEQDKDEMLRNALQRIIQLYSDRSHFIYELLQNAEDAGATKIKFEHTVDRLEVSHNGRPFSLENLKNLCNIGKSDKINNLNQIGEFGVGFKSVFGICETVYLYSHPTPKDEEARFEHYAVKINNFIIPEDIEDQIIETEFTTKFVFPFSVGLSFNSFKDIKSLNDTVSKRLKNLGVTTLLFMKNLQSIDYSINLPREKATGTYQLNKQLINDHCFLVTGSGNTAKNGKEDICYLVFSREVEGIQTGRTIDLAFPLTVDHAGVYHFKSETSARISVYFPTEQESKLTFIVQGPYRTTPDRALVPADNEENIDLAKQTAKLLRECITELRDAHKLNYSFLNILPIKGTEFRYSPLFECLCEETQRILKKEKVFLCRDGTYQSAYNVKIPRNKEFAELFTDGLYTELLNDGRKYHFLPSGFMCSNDFRGYLRTDLKIETVSLGNLKDNIIHNNVFLTRRSDKWLIQFYNLLESDRGLFEPWNNQNFLMTPIVKTSKGDFVSPYKKRESNSKDIYYTGYLYSIYDQNVFLPSNIIGNLDEINIVDKSLYQVCSSFFEGTLQLRQPNEYHYFVETFKKRYQNNYKDIEDEQHILDLKTLLKYYNTSLYRERIETLMKSYLKLKCKKDGETVYKNPQKSRVYFEITSNKLEIYQYFLGIKDYPYVDYEFYKERGINYADLKKLGVSDEVGFGLNQKNGNDYKLDRNKTVKWVAKGRFLKKLSLYEIDKVLDFMTESPRHPNSKEKSKFIFSFLVQHENELFGALDIGKETIQSYSDIVEMLCGDGQYDPRTGKKWRGRWLYNRKGTFVSPSAITKEELDPNLYGEVIQNSKIYEYLGFKDSQKHIKDSLEKSVKAFDELDSETRDVILEREIKKKFGYTTSQLQDIIDFANSKKESGSDTSKAGAVLESVPQADLEFPSKPVRDWQLLKTQVAQVLYYASPVEYQERMRSIRVSQSNEEIKSYLSLMYGIGSYKWYCQMCHEQIRNMEKCQIQDNMQKELPAMYLCMCPNCAATYRSSKNGSIHNGFINRIKNLHVQDIMTQDPVKIPHMGKQIWFTQTHVAEIKELMNLMDLIDKDGVIDKQTNRISNGNIYEHGNVVVHMDREAKFYTNQSPGESEDFIAVTNSVREKSQSRMDSQKSVTDNRNKKDVSDYQKDDFQITKEKEYIGKSFHDQELGNGIVKGIIPKSNGVYFEIEFIDGPNRGKTKQFLATLCLKYGLIG